MQNTARRRRKRKEESVSVDALDAIINAVQNNYMDDRERFRAIEQRAGVGLSFLGVLLGILIIYNGEIEYTVPNINQLNYESLLLFIFIFFLLIAVYFLLKSIVSRFCFQLDAVPMEKAAGEGLTFSGVLLGILIIFQYDYERLSLTIFGFSLLIAVYFLLKSMTSRTYFQVDTNLMGNTAGNILTYLGVLLGIIIIFQYDYESLFLTIFIFSLLISVYLLMNSLVARPYAYIDTDPIVKEDFFYKEVWYIKVAIARSYNKAINENTVIINKKSRECNLGIFAILGAFVSLIILYIL